MAVNYAEKFKQLLPRLSEEQKHDVLDLVERLARGSNSVRRQPSDRRAIVAETMGRFRQFPTTSDDYAREKEVERDAEERKGHTR